MRTRGSTSAETPDFIAACAVLGLSTEPSSRDARTAFRVRAALLHPDVHQSAGEGRMDAATIAMQQLNDAYQVVLESLVAGDRHPLDVADGPDGLTRRCVTCRREFQYAAGDDQVACRRCRGRRLRTRNPRSYSSNGPRAGRVVVSSSRPRTQRRTESQGRLSHLGVWYDAS